MSVTGLGGLRFACPDPPSLREWYARHLSLEFSGDGGAWFEGREPGTGAPAWSVFGPHAPDGGHFDPGTRPFRVAYRVRDLDTLLARLRADGDPVSEAEDGSDGGRRAWALDPEGQKVELWEPSDRLPEADVNDGPVHGIGGVFFKSPRVPELKVWYAKLGIVPGDDGYVMFLTETRDGSAGFSAWEIFPHDTTYFDSDGTPSPHPFMINFRVRDLDALLDRLRERGVWVDPRVESYEYGKFGWIVDPTGARVELWEPPH